MKCNINYIDYKYLLPPTQNNHYAKCELQMSDQTSQYCTLIVVFSWIIKLMLPVYIFLQD